MASGRHIMPLMCSSMLRNRDMMPLFSMTTGYRGRVPASVSAALTTAFTPPKVTTPREILHLHKRLLSHITENSVIYADSWNIKNFKHVKHRFLHPYLEKRVAGVYSAIAPFSGLWSFSFISVRGGKKNQSLSWLNHNETVRSQKCILATLHFFVMPCSTTAHNSIYGWHGPMALLSHRIERTRGLASWIDWKIMKSHSNEEADACSEWQEVVNGQWL